MEGSRVTPLLGTSRNMILAKRNSGAGTDLCELWSPRVQAAFGMGRSPSQGNLNEERGQKLAHGNPASWCWGQKCGQPEQPRVQKAGSGGWGAQGEARLCPAEEWDGMRQ